jgi:phosphate transport system ATP-binding protein
MSDASSARSTIAEPISAAEGDALKPAWENDDVAQVQTQEVAPAAEGAVRLEARQVNFWYGDFQALHDVSLEVQPGQITALIGPSGCGKTTFLRVFNRMHDLVPGTRVEGEVLFQGENVLSPQIDVIQLRRRVGMLFQRPNPFPKSIYDNVAYGPRMLGWGRERVDQVVEQSLKDTALWDEVKGRLRRSAMNLSGGQQQRLCLARALAVEPQAMLMDEPAAALDPIATLRIEELMQELKSRYTMVIVTHNMQQAARVSDFTAFMLMNSERAGELIEYGSTDDIFNRPKDSRTEDYITGRFG